MSRLLLKRFLMGATLGAACLAGTAFAADLDVGDEVITVSPAPVKDGKATKLEVPEGTTLTVVKVNGPWLAVEVDREGETVSGWIHEKHIKPKSGPVAVAEVIPESEVTPERLTQLFRRALLSAEVDKDNDVRVEEGGVKVFVRVDKSRKLLVFLGAWHLKEQVSMEDKLRLMNRWNDDLIFVRFCVPKDDTLWCDYFLPYEGGVCPRHVLAAYRLFHKVMTGAPTTQDPDDIVGEK